MRLKTSFVEVQEEPLHLEEFANNYLRIYRAILKPGISTFFHRHSRNTIYIALRGGKISTEKMKGTPYCPTVLADSLSLLQRFSLLLQNIFTNSLNITRGFVFYMASEENPVIHKATASGKNNENMELLGIEIYKFKSDMYRAPENYGMVEIETNQIIVYRIILNCNEGFESFKQIRKGIVIVLSGKVEIMGTEHVISLGTGDYCWIEDEYLRTIENQELKQGEILFILFK